jgi:hypothetical protein
VFTPRLIAIGVKPNSDKTWRPAFSGHGCAAADLPFADSKGKVASDPVESRQAGPDPRPPTTSAPQQKFRIDTEQREHPFWVVVERPLTKVGGLSNFFIPSAINKHAETDD